MVSWPESQRETTNIRRVVIKRKTRNSAAAYRSDLDQDVLNGVPLCIAGGL